MALARVTSVLARRQISLHARLQLPGMKRDMVFGIVAYRFLYTHHITKSISFITPDEQTTVVSNIFPNLRDRPLLVILSWLMAKRNHIMKFATMYMEQGFDVVTVSLTPMQLMLPIGGSHVVAADLLAFLEQNKNYKRILLHGFSVGGYLWGEVLALIHKDQEKYDDVMQRIIGQIWDSATDVTELTIGTPRAVFPNSTKLQGVLQKYLEYHLRTFQDLATQYYIRSSRLFHSNPVRSPALILVSKNDPIGTVTSNMRVRDTWDSLNVKTHMKIFEKSPHVGHYYTHPKEYIAELYAFLDMLNLIKKTEKVKAQS